MICPKTKETVDSDEIISPHVERKNAAYFVLAVSMTYLAAPVTYVGVVQAALCDQLGASATLSNLPSVLFVFGGIAPLFLSSIVPYRLERMISAISAATMAMAFGLLAALLIAPISTPAKIAAVIGQSSIVGVLSVVGQVYLFQCLKRGTTENGRARALKLTYAIGPLAAVAGSLLAQSLMEGRSDSWDNLGSYVTLYLVGVPCLLIAAAAISKLQLVDVKEEVSARTSSYLVESLRALLQSRPMLLLCCAYFANNAALGVLPNLSLHLPRATGFPREEWVGYGMALQFGFKSASGYLYGALAEKHGARLTLQMLQVPLFLISCWALLINGTAYIFVFALVGAAQLSGIYFPNYCLALSSNATGARNLSLLMIISSLAGLSSSSHGTMNDLLGAWASFCLSGVCAAVALRLVSKLPRYPQREQRR